MENKRNRVALGATATAAVLALGVSACGGGSKTDSAATAASSKTAASSGGTINGAGSTLAAPVYQQWGANLKGQGITLNYQPVGSGAGVTAWEQGTADFAASDPALKDDELGAASAKGGQPVHIPTVLGAITVSYDLGGVKTGLHLDGPTIAAIYLGKVTKWNAPQIAKLNPGVSLPAKAITVVHRSDSSGTTKGFTQFLADYSSAWKSGPGVDKTVKWPTGLGAKGNNGVAAAIKQSDGTIGYVESAYALQNGFTFAAVKNKSGTFVTPDLASTSAAATGLSLPADLRFSAIDAPGASAYPIVSQTFVIAHRDLCRGGMSAGTAKAFKAFLDYGLGAGQGVAKQLSYAPLPAPLLAKAKAQVAKLACDGKPIG
ncbi:MAG TPA: phosphate ABC transporter substrate-binding protein PstS [Solirubrobacteraceae bacterium]|nr:phosphate ABC transporter substrate-binding protein PstS [Solirubrobacteraceae bacterium]